MENFNEINAGDKNKQVSSSSAVNVKLPKRVLHFSDGTIEEFSDDDVDSTPIDKSQTALADPKSLKWGPWIMYALWAAGSTTLSACDYMGESLASFFGITTPKYYLEIEEYKRRKEEEKRFEEKRKGWSENVNSIELVENKEPNATAV